MHFDRILRGGNAGPAAIAGKPDDSLLIKAVRHESLKMPLGGKLKPEEIEALIEWVRAGAPWPKSTSEPSKSAAAPAPAAKSMITPETRAFWAFLALRKAPVPAVKDAGWPRNDIDRDGRERPGGAVLAKRIWEMRKHQMDECRVTPWKRDDVVPNSLDDLHGIGCIGMRRRSDPYPIGQPPESGSIPDKSRSSCSLVELLQPLVAWVPRHKGPQEEDRLVRNGYVQRRDRRPARKLIILAISGDVS